MNKFIGLALLGLIVVATSCYYDSEEAIYPSETGGIRACDTAAFTYSLTIEPIISANCYSCHSASAAPGSGGNINLQGYTNLKREADNGRLSGSITHASGYTAMPRNANKLSYCEIVYILRWIELKTPNN